MTEHAADRAKGVVLVLGATSGIARATAAGLARRGYGLFLAGRDEEELERVAADLGVRFGVTVQSGPFDALVTDDHGAFLSWVEEETADMGGLAGAVVAFGTMGDEARVFVDAAEADRVLRTNLNGAVSVLTPLAAHFEARGGGFLVGVSSVAGERGRKGNYVYGAAKAGLTAYLSGLRARLAPKGVRVVTVKPGFVDTAMTFGRPGTFLVASAEAVGERIARAVEWGPEVIYAPWFWRPVMAVVRAIPEPLFKRLAL